jgi:hypothetical protein
LQDPLAVLGPLWCLRRCVTSGRFVVRSGSAARVHLRGGFGSSSSALRFAPLHVVRLVTVE